MKHFSRAWISSKKPNKQRKYRFNAPLHVRGSLMNVHLSKDLRAKHNVRAVGLRTGDKVRIMRGQFKKQEGKVEEINLKTLKAYISKIEHVKRDGTKARYPIQPSNLMIVELNMDDKRRFKREKNTAKNEHTHTTAHAEAKHEVKSAPKTSTKSASEKKTVKKLKEE